MIAEQMPRNVLVKQWKVRLHELRTRGEDTRYVSRFLGEIDRLPGQTVGDLCHYWTVRQSELRPVWALVVTLLCLLGGLLAFQCGGSGAAFAVVSLIGVLGFCQQLTLIEQSEAFTRELIARADYSR